MEEIDKREWVAHPSGVSSEPAATPEASNERRSPPTAGPVGERKLETPFDGTSEFHGDTAPLFAALARAQGAFPPIPRTRLVTIPTKTGGSYKYLYAPLEDVIDACRAALADNGLAFVEKIVELTAGRLLLAYLTHESGSYMEGRILLGKVSDPKEFGSMVTYARRYQRQCMLGVSPEDDDDGAAADDDGRQPMTAPPRPQQQQAQRKPPERTASAPDADIDAMINDQAPPVDEADNVASCRRALVEYCEAAKGAKDIEALKATNLIMGPWANDQDPTVIKLLKEATSFFQKRYRELKR